MSLVCEHTIQPKSALNKNQNSSKKNQIKHRIHFKQIERLLVFVVQGAVTAVIWSSDESRAAAAQGYSKLVSA